MLTDHKISINNQCDTTVKEINTILGSYLSGKTFKVPCA